LPNKLLRKTDCSYGFTVVLDIIAKIKIKTLLNTKTQLKQTKITKISKNLLQINFPGK